MGLHHVAGALALVLSLVALTYAACDIALCGGSFAPFCDGVQEYPCKAVGLCHGVPSNRLIAGNCPKGSHPRQLKPVIDSSFDVM